MGTNKGIIFAPRSTTGPSLILPLFPEVQPPSRLLDHLNGWEVLVVDGGLLHAEPIDKAGCRKEETSVLGGSNLSKLISPEFTVGGFRVKILSSVQVYCKTLFPAKELFRTVQFELTNKLVSDPQQIEANLYKNITCNLLQ